MRAASDFVSAARRASVVRLHVPQHGALFSTVPGRLGHTFESMVKPPQEATSSHRNSQATVTSEFSAVSKSWVGETRQDADTEFENGLAQLKKTHGALNHSLVADLMARAKAGTLTAAQYASVRKLMLACEHPKPHPGLVRAFNVVGQHAFALASLEPESVNRTAPQSSGTTVGTGPAAVDGARSPNEAYVTFAQDLVRAHMAPQWAQFFSLCLGPERSDIYEREVLPGLNGAARPADGNTGNAWQPMRGMAQTDTALYMIEKHLDKSALPLFNAMLREVIQEDLRILSTAQGLEAAVRLGGRRNGSADRSPEQGEVLISRAPRA